MHPSVISPIVISFCLLANCLTTLCIGAELPNILILYADDMGYGDLGIQNPQSKIPTPNLDRLARDGMRFSDAHSSSGVCTPSRFALLSGQYHWRKFHGIVNAWGGSVFDAEQLTLPELLKSKGYATACIGKWHLGWDWDAIRKPNAEQITVNGTQQWPAAAFDWQLPIPDGPLAHGFDYYFGDDVPNFPPYAWIENDRIVAPPSIPYVPNPMPSEGSPEGRPGPMVADWQQDQVMPTLTRKAVDWIAGRQGKPEPFFLYFPWTSPHAPIVPTKEFQGTTPAGGFGDYMHQSDWTAGEVLKALDQYGFRENTLVIFSADNGPERYAYDRVRNFQHRSTGELRGLKRDIWEGGHRVPFVVRWPGHTPAGTISSELLSQIDVMATIAAIVGADLPSGQAIDSHNQLKLISGQGASARTNLVHNTKADHYAIRSGSWLLIDAPSGDVSQVPDWYSQEMGYDQEPKQEGVLINLSEDLSQRHNLFEKHPDRVMGMRELLARIRSMGEVR
ncbi:MAG: arylsulfatase [Planctomycetales bacterium]|nr:arylsulfatase [Planctomycetales bacterium]